jgi:DNA repair ATPase RecN
VEEKGQTEKNNFKYNFTKSKKIARPLNIDYKLLISSSEKVRDSEKLFESFLKVLIDDRQSIINKLETFRIEDNKLNKVIIGMKNELFELEKNYNNEINKIISNENDSKAELNNISNNLKLVDGELFDLKSFKKSEKQQLKLLKERKLDPDPELQNIRIIQILKTFKVTKTIKTTKMKTIIQAYVLDPMIINMKIKMGMFFYLTILKW